jgi:hypothetical protein
MFGHFPNFVWLRWAYSPDAGMAYNSAKIGFDNTKSIIGGYLITARIIP